MDSDAVSGKVLPAATGALAGVLTFLSLCIWFGLPIIPSTDNLHTVFRDAPSPYGALVDAPAGPTDPAEAAYVATCGACHQATGEGLAGTFPPLAGSEWVTGDPETPIRVVLAGLSGPIQVKGQTFNSMMPPPPGVDDEKIALIVTFVRSHFGNKASAVDKATVAAVRASLAGRSKPWSAEELSSLRKGAGDAPGAAPANPAAAPAATPVGAAPSGVTPGAQQNPAKP